MIGEGVAAVAASAHARGLRLGDVAQIAVTTENLHFFDAATRLAIWD